MDFTSEPLVMEALDVVPANVYSEANVAEATPEDVPADPSEHGDDDDVKEYQDVGEGPEKEEDPKPTKYQGYNAALAAAFAVLVAGVVAATADSTLGDGAMRRVAGVWVMAAAAVTAFAGLVTLGLIEASGLKSSLEW